MSKSLGKGLELVTLLSEASERGDGALSLAEIARLSALEKTTAFRLLRALHAKGFVSKDDAGRYQLGANVIAIARTAFETNALLQKSLPLMRALQSATDETVTLVERRGHEAITVHALHSEQLVRYMARVGAVIPLHLGASARAILAFAPKAVVDGVCSGALAAPTGASITDPLALRASLAEVRRLGYATSSGERAQGANAIAVPLLDAGGAAVGSLAVLAPTRGAAIDDERRRRWPRVLLDVVAGLQGTF
jgi:DNA-binding IclR family transcriptional regulator